MARPLRLELSGGLYHVTSRGDGRDDIYLSEEDREIWLAVLGQVCKRFNWVCHAWCQMTNHYHLVIETPEANLAAGMRQLNGVYTQRFNRLHGRVGHVFQGRYKAILVERDSYLLELARYVVLNPLRAGMVREPESWRWSSYLSTCGLAPAPEWLRTDWVLAQFGRRRVSAIRKYVQFVHQGARLPSIWTQLRGQIYLGSEAFVAQMHTQLEQRPSLDEIPRAQRRGAPQPLTDFESRYGRREAMARAYLSGQHTMAAIAEHFGVHYSTVSRMVRSHENSGKR
ncbi:Transposase, IS200-like [Aromatoleum bremense]|uniref:Addiction module toxin RelE n=1 Tax=Aromatoleum bremense TaxID=76115 RepID=A0ABX1NV22_9RHOO|nr:addiction module toxin RelE [Aromatoleum bremense]QTQ32075.1 Transposase, IS200-like [Aromatoleum bremense]